MKKHAPATLRNREAILAVLQQELPEWGTVLEVASGSGEHAIYFAGRIPQLAWQPSDPDSEAVASIRAYRDEYDGVNLRDPVTLDASAPESWGMQHAEAIVCINMVHISPWPATEGLFAGAAPLLAEGAPLILYGPYLEPGVATTRSNLAFDEGLRARNPEWGLRDIARVDDVARTHGFARTARHEMPANNLSLVYRRGA
ncbi:DUF938 domain-containing protein [Erythrobacter sp. JK5]|uniref:DUF938 domain-containing protein n=1 Tax=Erythrobacter sp. JK5 TaxID=2829500 RepID=UPI001BA97DC7|nr:DUF938 domain-containing protein [Erythrobacter sp. JK5]QUL36440.1 DUF938 domain-containing protein [Erythrobacter sp. JK5]